MYIDAFVNITSRAWALPILSHMHEGVAGRQAPLLAATGANRTAFTQSMDHLIDISLVERNPGYGHPLRPEFRLTEMGKTAADVAHKIYRAVEYKDQDIIRRSWTLPILVSLKKPSYFNDIKRDLPSITDRALSQSLQKMEHRNWVVRRVSGVARPPRSIYTAINTGGTISKITKSVISFEL